MKDKKRICRAWVLFAMSVVFTLALRIISAILSVSKLYNAELIIDFLYFLFMFATLALGIHLKRVRRTSDDFEDMEQERQ